MRVLLCAAAVAWTLSPSSQADSPWIIDTHTHFKGSRQIAAEHEKRQFDPRYLPAFQACMDAFGGDRLIFGTNRGVCTHFGDVDDVVRLALEFLNQHGQSSVQKVMRDNAIRVYRLAPATVN